MELRFYTNLYAFKFHYLDDFNNNEESDNFLSYLQTLLKGYRTISEQESDKELQNCNTEVIRQLKPEEAADYYLGIRAKHNKIVDFIEGLIEVERINKIRFPTSKKQNTELKDGMHLKNLMAFFFLPNVGTISDKKHFPRILQPYLKSETDAGKKYDIRNVISKVEKLKTLYYENLEGKDPYSDLLGIADSFMNYCNQLISEDDQIQDPQRKTKNIDAETGIEIDLLKYLSENFTSSYKRFNDLTKYNQIYRFLNEGRDYNIEHRAYKNLIKELFDFDYFDREIKGQTQKHLTQLENLALNYNNSKK